MLRTGATSATKRPQGGVGARKFAVVTLSIFLLFAGFFATAQRASADTGIPPSGVTGATTDSAAGVPPGSTTAIPPSAAGNDATAAPVDISQPTAQDAATGQAATADAAAAQPQQSNAIGATRADSSGDDSASQQNDVSAVGAAANGASTDQTAGSPSLAGASQQAATDQTANAAAAAVQPQQSNVAFTASSTASLPTPEHQATSSTPSAGRPRLEGAAGRSGVFGPNTAAAEGSDPASVYSDGSSIQAARTQAERTGAQDSRGAALGSVRDRVAGWLGRTATAARPTF